MNDAQGLSSDGRQRREEILAVMQRSARRGRLRRRAVDVGGVTLVVLVVGLAVWAGARPGGRGAAPKPPEVALGDPRSRGAEAVVAERGGGWASVIAVVSNDRGVASRLRSEVGDGEVARISDDELLRLLEESGRPAGIVRRDGQMELVPAPKVEGEPSASLPTHVT
ncbi:MAG: hypothetical protein H6811_01165 [Phycisphaeraceae bacterium]|nr:hypothetical protein [Phycisphaeraceae bacterium]